MNPGQKIPDDMSNIRIRNMLANIERTFLPVGSTIGKYRIIEEIDRGGMAVVYKATQLDLDRDVALKVMPANISINRRFVERFLTEAHAVAKLNHKNIVSIYEVATENNTYYLSMEYIPGKNLYYHLHYHKPKLVDVLEIVARLAEALAYAHEQRIIHRDLKLNNVIMRDRLTPVLIDFGLAKAMENDEVVRPGITRTGEIMGSPSYMAPERLLGGDVDHRSDICSLGIMLYEMLTFKNPYLDQRNLHQTTINVMESNPIPPRKLVPWLPLEIEAITLKAMAKDPSNRYQSMTEFKEDIIRYQHGDPVLARPPSIVSKVRHFSRRNWAPLVISGIVMLFSTLFLISFYIQSKKGQSHWQLIYNDKFGGKTEDNWQLHGEQLVPNDSSWVFEDGYLKGKSSATIFALLNLKFNRDILIECEINGNPLDMFGAGIFLSGDEPDSGYCFNINANGLGKHGLTMNGIPFMFSDIHSARVPLSTTNHLTIERIQNLIVFSINGTVVSKVYDNLPPLGKSHNKIGFFIRKGTARFDNLSIYRRAIPQTPSPTLIADRFWERGDFEVALDEYQGLLVDFPNSELVKEIKVKMADCLVRLGRYDEASKVINDCYLSIKGRDEIVLPSLFFLQGVVLTNQGNISAADSILKKLAILYPQSGVNLAAMNQVVLRCVNHIQNNRPAEAKKSIETIVSQYRRNYDKATSLFDELIAYYVQKKAIDTAKAIAEDVVTKYSKNEIVLVCGRLNLANIFLHKGLKNKAREMFDLVISAHLNSEKAWDAWMGLAEINEYDFIYNDAIGLYRKIYKECPRTSPHSWMAGISLGMLVGRDSIHTATSLFQNIADSDHPYPIPRLIASYFLGKVSDHEFKSAWEAIHPYDPMYLYYIARKEFIKGNQTAAQMLLTELKKKLKPREWRYFKILKILNNFSRW